MTLVTDVPASALAVYAHPDDPEISPGGTLARWAAAGCEVWVLIVTRGEKGTSDADADLDALAELRVEETGKAAELLGFAGHLHLGIGDGDVVDDAELRGAIVRHVRQLRPEVVFCPDPTAVFFGSSYFNHRDHRITGWATLDAVAPAAGNPHYFPEHLRRGPRRCTRSRAVYLSGTLEPNCWVDIGETLERKIDALFCHASQLAGTDDSLGEDWFRAFLRTSAEEAGRAAGVRHAEAFRKIDLG